MIVRTGMEEKCELAKSFNFRLMKDLARGKHNINEAILRLNIVEGDAKMDNSFLLDFPPIDKVNIYETVRCKF